MTEIRLPFPPSVNEAYGNNKRGKGRGRYRTQVYEAWRDQAGWELKAQKIQPVTERCTVIIDIDDRRRGDCANREKVVTDFLVHHGILRGDSKKYVRRVSIGWEAVAGCRVSIVTENPQQGKAARLNSGMETEHA